MQFQFDPLPWLCCAVFASVAWPLLQTALSGRRQPKDSDTTPFIGNPLGIVPRFLLNLVFAIKAADLLENGYQKFKSGAFRIVLGDKDALILPTSVLQELSTLPVAVASPHGALEHDLLGPYTGLDLVVDTRLHHSIIQRKLTPRLASITPMLQDELKHAFECEFPTAADEWTDFQPYFVLGQISARVSAHAIVGPTFSRNSEWLDIAFNYTENLFRTIVLLRLLPSWMRPVVCHFLPSYRASNRYIRKSKKLLGPKVAQLLAANDSGAWTPGDSDEDANVMSWLAGMAKGVDRNPETIAHIQVIVALAAVHTVLLRLVNVLYDLTAHPQLIDELRDEIRSVADRYGAQEGKTSPSSWPAKAYDELPKLESVLRESQRMSPPTTTGLKRVFRQSYTFANGIHVPAGTYVCMPIYAIENDAVQVSKDEQSKNNAAQFDGLRSYRDYLSDQAETDGAHERDFRFSTPTPTSLNFGYGRSACPGRFFASLTIKMVFVKLLTEYEFRFPGSNSNSNSNEEQESRRPKNMQVHEFLFTWPWQKLQVRRIRDSQCPF